MTRVDLRDGQYEEYRYHAVGYQRTANHPHPTKPEDQMLTVEAIYDNGVVHVKAPRSVKRAKVLVTFIEEYRPRRKRIKLPQIDMGQILNLDRGDLYGDYLADRH